MALPESAARYDIARTLGDARVFTLTRRTSKSGPVIDQTGMQASLTLTDRASGAAVATLTTANAGIAALDASGELRIDLAHAQYAALGAGQYAYHLDLVEAGRAVPKLRGTWSIVA